MAASEGFYGPWLGEDPDREQTVTGHYVFAMFTHLVACAEEMLLKCSRKT
jgi:hypothetical protein